MKKQLACLIASITVILVAGLVYTGSVHTTGPPGLLASGGGHELQAFPGATPVVDPVEALNNVNLNKAPGALEVNPDRLAEGNATFTYGGGPASKKDIAQQHNDVVSTVTEQATGDVGGATPLIMPIVANI